MSADVLLAADGKFCHQDVNRKLVALYSHQLPSEAVLETKEAVLDRSRSGTTVEQQKTEGWFSTRSEHLGPQRPKAPTTTAVDREKPDPITTADPQPERDKPDYVVIGEPKQWQTRKIRVGRKIASRLTHRVQNEQEETETRLSSRASA